MAPEHRLAGHARCGEVARGGSVTDQLHAFEAFSPADGGHPGDVALFDQTKADAAETLRSAHTFVLYVVREDGHAEAHGATSDEGLTREFLLWAARDLAEKAARV
jgi:hypothetical protein